MDAVVEAGYVLRLLAPVGPRRHRLEDEAGREQLVIGVGVGLGLGLELGLGLGLGWGSGSGSG